MNEKNLDYLKDTLKYLGFGEAAATQLERALKEGKPEFTISVQAEYNRQQVEALLHFRKSNQTELYFFNKYDATLKQGTDAAAYRQATFHINKGNGMTLKEAFNLLNGRAVYKNLERKDGQAYQAWVQLDLKQKDSNGQYPVNMYHQRYGFDLEKVLAAHPIKELQDGAQKEALLRSLQKGNLQSVTMLTEVGQERRFLEAAPQFKSINQYDEQLKPIRNQQDKTVGLEAGREPRQKQQALAGDEEVGELKKNRSRKKGLSI